MNIVKRIWNYFTKPADPRVNITELPQIVAHIKTYKDSNSKVFDSVVRLRILSARVGNPHIDEVVDSGVVPTLMKILREDTNPTMQLETSWILTNIASGSEQNTKHVVDLGMVPLFSHLVRESSSLFSSEVLQQALWGLGNIAGSTDISLKLLVESHAFDIIFQIFILADGHVAVQELSSWVLYNICHHNTQMSAAMVTKLIPAMGRLISAHLSNKRKWEDDAETEEDRKEEKGREFSIREIVRHCIWAMAEMTLHSSSLAVHLLLDYNLASVLIKLLSHNDSELVVQALRMLGEIMAGSDIQTQAILDLGVVGPIEELMKSKPNVDILIQTTWIVSNIAAGTRPQIKSLIDHGLFPLVIQIAKETPNRDVQKHKSWTLSNAASGGDVHQINYLVQNNIIPELSRSLSYLISINSSKDVISMLEALLIILKKGRVLWRNGKEARFWFFIKSIKEHAKEILDSLTSHPDPLVRDLSVKILGTYLETLDTDDEKEADSEGLLDPNLTLDDSFVRIYVDDSDDVQDLSDSDISDSDTY